VNFEAVPREALALVAALALAIALIQALALAGKRWLRRRRMSIRMERAVSGEARAPSFLEAHGYDVIAAQVVVEHPVRIDGRVVAITLRADYLAAKDGLRYAVEVKTGAFAPKIETSATRRQMLEYRIAFDVDGVVLVDGDTGSVHEITFPSLERLARPASSGWRFVALAVAAAAAVVAVVRLV
jgi:hypothetical protein